MSDMCDKSPEYQCGYNHGYRAQEEISSTILERACNRANKAEEILANQTESSLKNMLKLREENDVLAAKVAELEDVIHNMSEAYLNSIDMFNDLNLMNHETMNKNVELRKEKEQLREALQRCDPYSQLDYNGCKCDFCGNYEEHESDCEYVRLCGEVGE